MNGDRPRRWDLMQKRSARIKKFEEQFPECCVPVAR